MNVEAFTLIRGGAQKLQAVCQVVEGQMPRILIRKERTGLNSARGARTAMISCRYIVPDFEFP